ncbi:MAG: hypothetical protein WCY16_04900 [Weeksellaceae bacterium]
MRKIFGKYLMSVFGLMLIGCGSDDFSWYKTFESADTNPMGTYVLRQELPKIFPNSEITDIKGNTLDFFMDEFLTDEHYFFIHSDTYIIPDYTWEEVMWKVNQGGSAFISSYNFSSELTDSLGFDTKPSMPMKSESSVRYSVKKPEGEKTYVYTGQSKNYSYFSNYNPQNTEVLGYAEFENKKKEPNYIKVYYGKGYLLLHAEPVLFSNYEMLKTDHFKYVTDAFSYIDDTGIVWDNYRTARRNQVSSNEDGGFFSSLSFIMKHKSLKMAFLTLLALGILYLLFNSKRRQRAQEVILPYSNHTLDFTKTLAELYRYNTDHTAMTKYKINYFLEQLRMNYNITARDTEKDFTDLLAAKSGADRETCQNLVNVINSYRTRNYLNKTDFVRIQSIIETFNRKIKFNGRKSG